MEPYLETREHISGFWILDPAYMGAEAGWCADARPVAACTAASGRGCVSSSQPQQRKKFQPRNMETQMRKLRIMEHITLDGVIQHTADDDNFPYVDWNVPYRTPAGRDALFAASGGSFDLLLGRRTYDIWSGFWPKAPKAVRWRTASMRRKKYASSLLTVRKVLNGARSRASDRTSSEEHSPHRSRRTARTLSSRVAPR